MKAERRAESLFDDWENLTEDERIQLLQDAGYPEYIPEEHDAEQVVPFGVVGGGNDFGQNLAEDFGAESKGMMNMVFGMGLALAAGIGAKMMIDRMDGKEEALILRNLRKNLRKPLTSEGIE